MKNAPTDDLRIRVAQPADLLACFNDAAGFDLTGLWNHWFEEMHGLENSDAIPSGTPAGDAAS
jgi:hypothetical protein